MVQASTRGNSQPSLFSSFACADWLVFVGLVLHLLVKCNRKFEQSEDRMINQQTGEQYDVGAGPTPEPFGQVDDRSDRSVSRWVQYFLEKFFRWDTGPFQGF